MARQLEVPGTERKYSKAMRDAGDAYADSVKTHSKASSKKKEKMQAALDQMRKDDLLVYVDTESEPPFQLERTTEDKLVRKAYKPPPPAEVEGEPEEASAGEQRAAKKKPSAEA